MSRITVLKRCILYTIKRPEISHFLQYSLTILEVLAILFFNLRFHLVRLGE